MRYFLMYNPVSGRANFKCKLPYIKRIFERTEHSLTIYESRKPKDLQKVSYDESSKYDVYLVAGGDGTINEVVNGLMKAEKKPVLGIIPNGTSNDISAIFGMNKDIKRTLKIVLTKNPISMDVNKINDQFFLYTTASGILSKISYDVSRRHIAKYGYLAYVIAGVKDIILDYKYPVKISFDNKHIKCECMMVLGMSTDRVGGRRLMNFSKAKLNDGLFDIRLFTRSKKLWRFRFLSSLALGGKKMGEDYHIVSDKFKIETRSDVQWNADGEYSCSGNVVIETYKEALKVIVSDRTKRKFF